ncbi:MAG: chloride channel protein [Flavobacteriales bacterium]|nr:chloride channel protein [Flavobacteriales bacterium]
MAHPTSILGKFLIWRVKHISNKKFIHILSIIIGITSGLGAVVLKNATHLIQDLLHHESIGEYHNYFYFIFPTIGILLTLIIIKYVIKENVGHGIPSTLYAISKRKGVMRRYQMWGSIITAPLTVGFGGSVGLEGPTVATGSAIGSNIARMFHMNAKTRIMLLGAAAAGAMSAIFKAPIAAIIFAVEVFSLDLTLISLIPLLLASVSAIVTSYLFLGNDFILHFKLVDIFAISDLPPFIILGVAAAFTSIYFSTVYFKIGDYFETIQSPAKKLLIGGLAIGVIIFFIPPLYGEGFKVINELLEGVIPSSLEKFTYYEHLSSSPWAIIALLAGLVVFKIIATATTFGAGGIGGIFAPTLFMGSIMGNVIARTINLLPLGFEVSVTNFTLVGMTGLMAGVLHAPLTAIFLIAELTGGYELFIPLMLTALISYTIAKTFIPHSVYHRELAKKGQLITHDKDKAVLTLMDLDRVLETNFTPINSEMSLGDLVHKVVSQSKRNIFPVINENDELLGILSLDDIRQIMFDYKIYETTFVRTFMHNPPEVIMGDKDSMSIIMRKFQDSGAWNLPVVRNGKYAGFVSKSKLLTVYRRKLIEVSGQ